MVFTVFTKELFTVNISGIMFDMLAYPFFLGYFIFNLKRIFLHIKIILFGICVSVTSIFSILFLDLSFFPFFKQIVPIITFLIACNDILIKNYHKIKDIFGLYVFVAFLSASFGIVQWVLSIFGLNILIGKPGLLDSIAYEPSHYAAIIMPAAVYTFYNFKHYKWFFLIIITSLILTFSFTSYFVLALFISFPYLRIKKLPTFVIILSLGILIFPFTPARVLERVTSLINYRSDGNYFDINTFGTIFSFASNLDVALFTIKKSPIWGSGLGGHESMYFKFFNNTSLISHPLFGINYNSAHSLTIRILSELGILGMVGYVMFFIKTFIKNTPQDRVPHILWISCFSHFICKSLKLGGYIDYGTPFFFSFIMMLYIINRKHRIN